MTIMKNKLPIIDNGPIQTIYADEIASAEIVGSNVRIVFAEIKTLAGERVLEPVIAMVRPLSSCLQLTLQDMLQPQVAPAEDLPKLMPLRH